MTVISLLAHFSRTHCVGICAALVPLMLIATVLCLGLAYWQPGRQRIGVAYLVTIALCGLMVLHVSSWFAIGVITPITFILLGLALTCITAGGLAWRSPPWFPTASMPVLTSP